ncbi:MAG: LemA family protein [Verrucomicrobia bacterium]|nr:MAG: LemA family protein [Verrucomicrobiota bacterium]MDH4469992.1 LemA family protein [Verrucomicrobiae bacterium]
MNNSFRILLIIAAIVVFLAISSVVFVVGIYNGLVSASQSVDAAWAQVQNVYQRRADLVPNLVQTVAGAAQFEQSTMVEVTEARASVGRAQLNTNQAPTDPAQLAAFQQAQGQLGTALSRLLVVSERYPDLKSSQNFRDLQAQLEGTENRISVERERFNTAVQVYNIKVRSFPAIFLAGFMGYGPKPYFTANPTSETAPSVKFDFSNKK